MARPEIEPRSPWLLTNTVNIMPMSENILFQYISSENKLVGWLVVWVLWHINLYRLLMQKPILYK